MHKSCEKNRKGEVHERRNGSEEEEVQIREELLAWKANPDEDLQKIDMPVDGNNGLLLRETQTGVLFLGNGKETTPKGRKKGCRG